MDRAALMDRRLPHDRNNPDEQRSHNGPMSDENTTVRAADLAERILDEVSEADQDWHTIERCARELYELAARVAQPAAAPLSRES
jgi:type II secretory pathway predicted ATPase ExeA